MSPRRFDALLFVLGAMTGVLSIGYPLGHDQGVHYYIAREWVLHGLIPYRDTFDYKTPGIFVLHALAILVFGEHAWGIRILELVCVACLGVIVAGLAGGAGKRGFVGFCCFLTFVLYYGYFTFWDSAQCEIWAATFAGGSILATRGSRVHAGLAGALAACAFLMKPPGVLLAIPAAWYCFGNRRDAAWFVAMFLAPLGATVAYFAAHGALGAMIDILVRADAQYVVGTRLVDSPGQLYEKLVDLVCWFHPFAALLVALVIGATAMAFAERRALGFSRETLVLGLLAVAAVAVQLKFYRYHFALLVLPLALGIAHLALRYVPERPGVAAVVTFALYGISGVPSRNWLWDQGATFRYATGSISSDELAMRFRIPGLAYDAHESETIGRWVRDHSSSDELLMVRTFQPEVYAYAHRRAPGRFFWTTPFMDAKRSYKRDEWRAEDERAVATQPRLVVTMTDATGADAISRFTKLGWERCHASGRMIVLARPKSAACDEP